MVRIDRFRANAQVLANSLTPEGRPTDIVVVVASRVYRVPEPVVSPGMKRQVKSLLFWRVYGGGRP